MPKRQIRARPLGTTTINTVMDEAYAKMDRDRKNRLVVSETVGGRQFTLVEIERKVGPLAANDNNNNFC